MQSLLLLLLSSTKITFTDDLSSTNVILILLSSTKVTLTDNPESEEDLGIPSVKYNLQLGDLNIKTELSTSNKNSFGDTKEPDSDEKGIWKEQDNSTASKDDNKGSAELARWREKRVWEKMAASKTWEAMKNAWHEELYYIKIKKMSYKECKNRLARLKHSDGYTHDTLLHKGVLCTRQGKLRDACQGDSGGPLYHITPDKKQKGKENLGPWNLLVGIVSWGAGCAKPGRPAMYVDVHYFNDWIKSAFKKLKGRRRRRGRRN